MAADAPLLTEDIRADNAQQYLARTVQRVSEVDMLGVYDIKGKPTVFCDLVSGAGDVSLLPELKADTVSRLCSEEKPVLSNDEMPDGADRCAYAVMRDENGQATGIVMAGLYLRSYHRTVLRVLLSFFQALLVIENELDAFLLGIDLQGSIEGLTTLGGHSFHFHGFALNKVFILCIRKCNALYLFGNVHTVGT